MSNPQQADTEARLHKLGQKVREEWAERHPAPDKNLDVFKTVVREQWEQEQTAERERKPAPEAAKEPERKPDGPVWNYNLRFQDLRPFTVRAKCVSPNVLRNNGKASLMPWTKLGGSRPSLNVIYLDCLAKRSS